MRIATWNLECPGLGNDARNQAVLEKIREVNTDIWILTETHEVIDLSETHHGVTTTPSLRKPRSGEACAAIWSRRPIRRQLDTADSRIGVARLELPDVLPPHRTAHAPDSKV